MFSMKCKETSTIVWESQRTFIATQDLFREEEPLKCKFLRGSMKKEANTQVSSNYPSKQVFYCLILVGYAL